MEQLPVKCQSSLFSYNSPIINMAAIQYCMIIELDTSISYQNISFPLLVIRAINLQFFKTVYFLYLR